MSTKTRLAHPKGSGAEGRRLSAVLAALTLPVLLAGCSSLFGGDDEERQAAQAMAPARCPRVAVLRDASEVTEFRQGAGRDLTDVLSRAAVVDFSGNCRPEQGRVTVDFRLVLGAERGPAWQGQQPTYQYFVAVADQQGQVLSKQLFDAPMQFAEGQSRTGSIEELSQTIPLPENRRAQDYQVFVGFQLTPDQVRFNRSNRAF
ncbi:hypothetical protein [Arenibaculum pallidiluteum]|uniref:hypothetical protein n=1 Tax=Arenibaculum pallidiluteum TaxID=2812559 RepID=UPI001F261C16|nr:hypothetical protein [Arenibaculum pallidiluteum]